MPIEEHPDLMELRARHDRAAATPRAQMIEALALITGLYLAASPWIVGFNGFTTLAVTNLANRRYYESATGLSQVRPGAPRALLLTAAYKF